MPCFLEHIEDPSAQDRNVAKLRRQEHERAALVGERPAEIPYWTPDRCCLCGAPVADQRGLRIRVVGDPSKDQQPAAVTDDESATMLHAGGTDYGVYRVGSDCFRRNQAELQRYVRKP